MRQIADVNNLSDFGLCIGDKVVAVHRCLVSVRWPSYFEESTQESLLRLGVVSANTINHIQAFLYGDELPGIEFTTIGSVMPEEVVLNPPGLETEEVVDALIELRVCN